MAEDAFIRHLREAGRLWGKAGTGAQKRARTLNLYRGLLKRWPHSASIKRKIKELEGESGND